MLQRCTQSEVLGTFTDHGSYQRPAGNFSVVCLLLIGWTAFESRADSVPQVYENVLSQANADTDQFSFTYQGRLRLANRLARKGHYDLAIQVFNRLIENFSGSVDIQQFRGRAHAWDENFSRAQEDLKTVLEKNPEYPDAWQMLGNVYRWSDQVDSAAYAYTNWIKLQPDRPEPYRHWRRLYRSQGQYELANKDGHLRFQEADIFLFL